MNSSLAIFIFVVILLIAIIYILITPSKEEIEKRVAEIQKENERHEQLIKQINSYALTPISTEKAILRKNETCYFSSNASYHEMKTIKSNFKGASTRIRIAKGVSVSLGGGNATKDSRLVHSADGELVITDKRVVFAGDNASFDFPLSRVINIETHLDGLQISVSNRKASYILMLDFYYVLLFERVYHLAHRLD